MPAHAADGQNAPEAKDRASTLEYTADEITDAGANFFGITNLENPADNLLHLIVGIWAAAAAYVNKQPAEAMTPRMAA